MARQKSPYSGALRTPIDLRSLEPLDPRIKTIEDKVKHEVERKFGLLLKHHKIDPNLPPERLLLVLSLKLAFSHVPGFEIIISKRRGRRKIYDLEGARRIVAAVDAHKSSKGIKVAIASAIKQKDWTWGRNIPSIATRYHEARRQIMRHELAMRHPPFSAERLLAYCDIPPSQRATKMRTR